MAGKGGYQAPRNPAPASGPGKLARRTDGGPAQKIMTPTGLPYGDAGRISAMEHAAPLAQSPSVPTMPVGDPGGGPPQQQSPLAGLGDPTTRPDEPVTAGVDIGAGPGSEVMPWNVGQQASGELSNLLSTLSASDTTGSIAALMMEAQRRGL